MPREREGNECTSSEGETESEADREAETKRKKKKIEQSRKKHREDYNLMHNKITHEE